MIFRSSMRHVLGYPPVTSMLLIGNKRNPGALLTDRAEGHRAGRARGRSLQQRSNGRRR